MTNRPKMRARRRNLRMFSNHKKKSELYVQHYCLAFIDLLGQKEAMAGTGILPEVTTSEDEDQRIAMIRDTVGAIAALHTQANSLLAGYLERPKNSPLRAQLPANLRADWDRTRKVRLDQQRWSDGIVLFAGLNEHDDIVCKMNAVFGIFMMAGALTLMGLASGKPIRGAINIEWGIELFPREIYGPVVTHAAIMESDCAQWPRMVVSETTVDYLRLWQCDSRTDAASQINKSLAQRCLGMVKQDEVDNQYIVDYLGKEFVEAVTKAAYPSIYEQALAFVEGQLQLHKSGSKLHTRYKYVQDYFDKNPPAGISPISRPQKQNNVVISKLDAARIQLNAAIAHFFKDEHVPALTLAGAAEDILAGLLNAAGKQSPFEFLHGWCQAEYGGTISKADFSRSYANFGRNWLKHAKDDSETQLESPQLESIQMLMRALPAYRDLVGAYTPEMEQFDKYLKHNREKIAALFYQV